MPEPDNLVLNLLREMRGEMATKSDVAALERKISDLDGKVMSLAADVASDLLTLEKRLSEQIVGLRRKIEQHLGLAGH